MFSPEQEAQLTRWGCPERYSYDPGFDDPILARQPHDVLAWLGAAYSADAMLYNSGVVSWKAALFGCSVPKWHPDPYAATYALAQAVMEAK